MLLSSRDKSPSGGVGTWHMGELVLLEKTAGGSFVSADVSASSSPAEEELALELRSAGASPWYRNRSRTLNVE